jgi:tyrosine 3-monooxygenase
VLTDAGLTEEEVLLEKAASQDKDAEMAVQRATLVLRLREGINSLARVLKVIEVRKIRHNINLKFN